MIIDIITLFPEFCELYLGSGLLGRSVLKNINEFHCHDLKEYGEGIHKKVDDSPFGGGGGMILKAEPIYNCWQNIVKLRALRPKFVFLTPKGSLFNQDYAKKLSKLDNLIFLCGRFEGVDQRVIDILADENISMGNFVISSGELAALTIIDATVRMIPNVLSPNSSIEEETHFEEGYLEHPQYTRPRIWKNIDVPQVLLSGNHEKIKNWKTMFKNKKIE